MAESGFEVSRINCETAKNIKSFGSGSFSAWAKFLALIRA
jgi:hypothetical protein